MISIITIISLLIICLVLITLFFPKIFNKTICIILLSISLWLPLYNMNLSLGKAIESAPKGMIKVITSIVPDYKNLDIYLLVRNIEKNNAPRLHKIKLNREQMNRLRDEGASYDQEVYRVQGDGTGAYEVIYVDFTPPDLQKGGVQRSYQNNEQ